MNFPSTTTIRFLRRQEKCHLQRLLIVNGRFCLHHSNFRRNNFIRQFRHNNEYVSARLSLMTAVNLRFARLIRRIRPNAFHQRVRSAMPRIRTILSGLMHTIHVRRHMSFLLILPRIVLTQKASVFSSHPQGSNAIIMVTSGSLIREERCPNERFLFQELYRYPISALVSMRRILQFSKGHFHDRSSRPFNGETIFQGVTRCVRHRLPFQTTRNRMLVRSDRVQVPIRSVAVSTRKFLIRLIIIPFHRHSVGIVIHNKCGRVPSNRRSVRYLNNAKGRRISSSGRFPSVPFPTGSRNLLPINLRYESIIFQSISIVRWRGTKFILFRAG